MAIACRLLLTLPPLPPRPRFNSPCLNSCMTRPVVLRWRGDDRAIYLLLNRATPHEASPVLSRWKPTGMAMLGFGDARADRRRPTQQEHRTVKVVHGPQGISSPANGGAWRRPRQVMALVCRLLLHLLGERDCQSLLLGVLRFSPSRRRPGTATPSSSPLVRKRSHPLAENEPPFSHLGSRHLVRG